MTSGCPEITWVNHASFVYSDGKSRLLCDPWLTGSAFNNGWRHITATCFRVDDFSDVSHVWISHQHPDHFAPQDLRRVPKADRERVQVLYQTVPDKLVVSWLRSAGYRNVHELKMQRWFKLSGDIDVMSGALGDDSWLAIRGHGKTLLNVNDCVLKRQREIEAIKDLVGHVDILLTQFSYAQWTGNASDTARRRTDALEKLERIRLQCEILQPNTVMPFASFIYFTNVENFFMNDAMNHIGDVAEFIERDLKRHVVVLYPGETWSINDLPDWRPAAARYEADTTARLAAGPVDAPAACDLSLFQSQVRDFLQRVRKKNPLIDVFFRDKTSFYLTDHQRAFVLDSRGLREIQANRADVDVVTATENVLYAFRMPWGGNTLHVSGRFESHVPGGHLRFFSMMSKLHYYNRTAIDRQWVVKQFDRIKRSLIRRLNRAVNRKSHSILSRDAVETR